MACKGKLEIYYLDGIQTGEWKLICEGDCESGKCCETYVTGTFGKHKKPVTRVFCGCVEAGSEPEDLGSNFNDETGRDEPEECHIFLGLELGGRPAKIRLHAGCMGTCATGDCGEARDLPKSFGEVRGPNVRTFIRPQKLPDGTSRAIEVREYTCACT